ncbi:hypothetical protein M405DRAFT_868003 [Rhizopogon salebrosus TDB-379]|nr:hypothetical protein M405DRAFT_868003 [Rhizopogon salebrosus TDB-379]
MLIIRGMRLKHANESYDELNKYLAAVESRAADVCAGFQRILRDAGGHLVLTPISTTSSRTHQVLSLHPPPLTVYALAQAALMTLCPSLHKCPLLLLPLYPMTLYRQPPYPADRPTPTLATASTPPGSNRSTTNATSSSIPLTNHILTLIPA